MPAECIRIFNTTNCDFINTAEYLSRWLYQYLFKALINGNKNKHLKKQCKQRVLLHIEYVATTLYS